MLCKEVRALVSGVCCRCKMAISFNIDAHASSRPGCNNVNWRRLVVTMVVVMGNNDDDDDDGDDGDDDDTSDSDNSGDDDSAESHAEDLSHAPCHSQARCAPPSLPLTAPPDPLSEAAKPPFVSDGTDATERLPPVCAQWTRLRGVAASLSDSNRFDDAGAARILEITISPTPRGAANPSLCVADNDLAAWPRCSRLRI
mmetsp:Transcript_36591/g.77115  ORF Transcript_36591/g.77115 Transcript_36591/m.77115 type:complete len:199 (+) Transcript_36591:267-863(+)